MLSSVRKLGGARLHLLAEHGRLSVLLSDAYACVPSLALVQSSLTAQRQSFSTTASSPQDEDEPELTLPDDLSLIGKLNPQLRDVILAHDKYERASAKDALRLRLQDLITHADPSKPAANVNVTKTALSKLRVDQLRQELEEESSDTRGNKDTLVQRLLALLQERERQQGQVLPAMEDLKEGVVTRRQVSQQEKRAARKAQHPSTYGISEAGLRDAQAAAADKTQFAHVFTPEKVADMLLDARAADVCIIDVRRRCPFTDYFVVATARSQRLVSVLAAGVLHQLKERCREVAPGVAPTIEGKDDSEWQVVDAGSVVVHVFLEGYREEYDLEGLWGTHDAGNIRFLEPKQTVQTLDTIR